MINQIAVTKDDENEQPIPNTWRHIFTEIINAFANKDYLLEGLSNVSPVSNETAKHIKDYIEDYDEMLIPLPEETWQYSVCIWMGNHWDVLIDLWTEGEGRSDMVLSAKVTKSESKDEYLVNINMVYVP